MWTREKKNRWGRQERDWMKRGEKETKWRQERNRERREKIKWREERQKRERRENLKIGEKGERGGRARREEKETEEREERKNLKIGGRGEREKDEKSMYFLGQGENRCKVMIARSMQVLYYILYQFRCKSTSPIWNAQIAHVRLILRISRSGVRFFNQTASALSAS